LIFDAQGNLYGTTYNGGASDNGTVFKLTKSGKEALIYSFTGGAGGANPEAGLIFEQGNLYGTTAAGGASGDGVVFKVSESGRENVVYNFTGKTDGRFPYAGLIFDAQGNLYGTTAAGGAYHNGAVFKVSKSGKETIIYSFTGGADGGSPQPGLTFDAKGNLYGTTVSGGASNSGVVFELSK
jgi:uncharacterized repeat protein (TIGR03803 family)